MNHQEFFQIGVDNADAAIDQVNSHANLEEALSDYFDNLNDTLTEMGIKEWNDQACSAYRGFISVLKKAGIDYRPHGLAQEL